LKRGDVLLLEKPIFAGWAENRKSVLQEKRRKIRLKVLGIDGRGGAGKIDGFSGWVNLR